MNKQIICMKWGDLYGPEYVNRLYKMVEKNLDDDFRFVCLTDNPEGLLTGIETYPCPEIDIPMPYARMGWRKLMLFGQSNDLFDLTGRWLYLDLDVVISGSLQDFFSYKPESHYIVMRNWTQPEKNIGNTSVYRFDVGHDEYLKTQLLENHKEIFSKYNNSQTYISYNVNSIEFWPDDWCLLFKVQCLPSWPRRFFVAPELPETARVVAFPGVPNPHQAMVGEWPVKSLYKKLYKFTRPAPWIKKLWYDSV